MQGINYVTNEKGERVAVMIDLEKHGALWEDFYDGLTAKKRKKKPRESVAAVKEALRKKGKLNAWLFGSVRAFSTQRARIAFIKSRNQNIRKDRGTRFGPEAAGGVKSFVVLLTCSGYELGIIASYTPSTTTSLSSRS